MANPLDSHWNVVKRILQYLKGTLFYGLHFQPTSFTRFVPLCAFRDVDWASDVDDCRSTFGVASFLGTNLISWWSRKQQVIARRSSIEAEFSINFGWIAVNFQVTYWTSKIRSSLLLFIMIIKVLFPLLIIQSSTSEPSTWKLMFPLFKRRLWSNSWKFLIFLLLISEQILWPSLFLRHASFFFVPNSMWRIFYWKIFSLSLRGLLVYVSVQLSICVIIYKYQIVQHTSIGRHVNKID